MPLSLEMSKRYAQGYYDEAGLGLTKREVFAKAAMQAILANTHLIDNLDSASVDFLVTKSAIVADAQLAQLDKGDK